MNDNLHKHNYVSISLYRDLNLGIYAVHSKLYLIIIQDYKVVSAILHCLYKQKKMKETNVTHVNSLECLPTYQVQINKPIKGTLDLGMFVFCFVCLFVCFVLFHFVFCFLFCFCFFHFYRKHKHEINDNPV